MSFDVTTLALAKSYADQHGGGGGASTASDFIIKMTVESDYEGNYTVTSRDKTIEQIDAAYNADKNIFLKVAASGYQGDFSCSLPVVSAAQGSYYFFAGFDDIYVYVAYFGSDNSTFVVSSFSAGNINYSNTALPNVKNVKAALDALVPKSHTHSNKAILDKFAESDGQPTYDGKKISGASTAEEVEYTNAILPDASNVKSALDDTIDTQQTQSADIESLRSGVSALIDAYETQGGDIASLKTKSHTHANKDTLDKLSVSNGKLQYNSSDILIKSDKQEIVNDVLAALPTWTGGSY